MLSEGFFLTPAINIVMLISGGEHMDIKEYRYIYEIAKQGGISKAAKELFMSQPSLSVYLKGIESRLEVTLFERIDGKLLPTREGEVYLEYAKQILNMDDLLMKQLTEMKEKDRGLVHLGIALTRSTYLLPSLPPILHEKHPRIQIQIFEGSSKKLEEKAHYRQLDLVLLNRPFREYELAYQILQEERVVLLAPDSFGLDQYARLDDREPYPILESKYLDQLPLTMMSHGKRLRQMIDYLIVSADIKPQIIAETQSMETAFSMVKAGLCACLVYDTYCTVKNMETVRVFQLDTLSLENQFVIAYPPAQALSGPAQALRDTICQYYQTHDLGGKLREVR